MRNLRRLVVPSASLVFLVGCGEVESAPPKVPVIAQHQQRIVVEEEEVGVSAHPPVRRAPATFDDADPESIRLFYDVLAAYGSWTDDARLGLVWTPSKEAVGASFVPYASHGRWTHRDAAGTPDWVWVSELPWGWITFHYGRWAYTGDKGWAWISGRQYAGAWVDWRTPSATDTSIVGWGPTPPSQVWRVSPDGVHAMSYSAFATPYVYAKTKDLFAPDVGKRLMPAGAALAVAYTTEPGRAPTPDKLGIAKEAVPLPPLMDRGLQQAWMLATPATAKAVGLGPQLGAPPRLRTYVAGGPRYAITFSGAR
ncbi:MAG: hypothetical protein KIT84_21130 [Labilithrix sp.]|nr:hypothetical protein [Labilithrix sp.]MCW5813546.1 hypothetical protein [Labilithrix sp.]